MPTDNPDLIKKERSPSPPVEHQSQQATIGGFVNAELSLIGSLPRNFTQAFKDNLKDHWPALVVEAGAGVVIGAVLAAVTRNPAIVGRTIGQFIGKDRFALGELLAPSVAKATKAAPYIFGAGAIYDVGNRLGTPGWDLMLHPENQKSIAHAFAGNLSSLVQDYTVMGVAGAAGSKFALGRTAPYVNRGPEVDFTARDQWAAENPDKLNKGARVTNPEKHVFAQENEVAPDVEKHYNKAFPEKERQAVHGPGGYNEKIEQGANMVYTLRDKATGELAAAHILGVHDQPDPTPASQGMVRDFGNWFMNRHPDQLRTMHGDFIFVRDDLRSQGIGSYMYDLVDTAIQAKAKADGKHLTALTGEMEDPKEPAVQLLDLVNKTNDRVPSSNQSSDPIKDAKELLAIFRQQFSTGIQNEDPEKLGAMMLSDLRNQELLASHVSADSLSASADPESQRVGQQRSANPQEAREIGEALQTLDERLRRQEFYLALPNPKVDSGIKWKIQDFLDDDYRGDAHWTSVVYDPAKFAPREAGYNFMIDEAGYTKGLYSDQVLEYMRNNNYYRAEASTAYWGGSLLGGLTSITPNHSKDIGPAATISGVFSKRSPLRPASEEATAESSRKRLTRERSRAVDDQSDRQMQFRARKRLEAEHATSSIEHQSLFHSHRSLGPMHQVTGANNNAIRELLRTDTLSAKTIERMKRLHSDASVAQRSHMSGQPFYNAIDPPAFFFRPESNGATDRSILNAVTQLPKGRMDWPSTNHLIKLLQGDNRSKRQSAQLARRSVQANPLIPDRAMSL